MGYLFNERFEERYKREVEVNKQLKENFKPLLLGTEKKFEYALTVLDGMYPDVEDQNKFIFTVLAMVGINELRMECEKEDHSDLKPKIDLDYHTPLGRSQETTELREQVSFSAQFTKWMCKNCYADFYEPVTNPLLIATKRRQEYSYCPICGSKITNRIWLNGSHKEEGEQK